MSGLALSFGFNDSVIQHHLLSLIRADGNHFTSARREIGEFMVGDIQDNLDGQKQYTGAPMHQSKAAIKRRGKTLIDHHHLYDSYVHQLVGAGVEVGSSKVYAAIHHAGGVTGRGHKTRIEANPVMGVGDRQERSLGDILINELRRLQ